MHIQCPKFVQQPWLWFALVNRVIINTHFINSQNQIEGGFTDAYLNVHWLQYASKCEPSHLTPLGIRTNSPLLVWDIAVWDQIVYSGTDLCGLSHSFVFPWKRAWYTHDLMIKQWHHEALDTKIHTICADNRFQIKKHHCTAYRRVAPTFLGAILYETWRLIWKYDVVTWLACARGRNVFRLV